MRYNLSDSRIKLARAREHIADVERRIAAYLHTDFYRIRLEPDQGGKLKVEFDSLHQPDKSINAVIGDAIGNLRSVLDYVAVALVKPVTGKTDDITFPFADDVKGFEGEARKRFSVCPAPIQDYIINDVQAYKGGKGHSFWTANKLRNIDKHRFLITALHLVGISLSFECNGIMFRNNPYMIMAGEGATYLDVGGPADLKITDKPDLSFEVQINESPIVRETPVGLLLHRIASDTERLLDALEVFS